MRGLARIALVGIVVAGVLAAGAVSAQAFTLIQYPRPSVSVSPTSGLPTAAFKVRGKQALPGVPCPVAAPPASILFKFFWYKVISSKVQIWTKTTNSCSNVGGTGVIDTGPSPAITPPAPLNYPGTFVIQVATYNASTGAPLSPTYTNTTVYKVLAPKPSPSPSPKPSPTCGQVGAATCPSPTPSQCTAGTTGMVPPAAGGRDAGVMLALVVFGTLPVGGIVLFSSLGWKRRRWQGVIALVGLSVILITASGCAAIVGQNNPTPSQSEPSPTPSPSPSPSPSCPTA